MKTIRKKVKAIIFDMDGTIIKSSHVWHASILEVLKKYGITTFTEQQKKAYGATAGMALIESAQCFIRIFDLNVTADVLCEEMVQMGRRYITSSIKFVDGFEKFHQKLIDNAIFTGIATNAPPENLKEFIKKLNFDKFFGNDIYDISHVNYKPKPDPALFLYVAKKLGAQPEECVVFEDSIYGFNAAKSAGMKCIAIKHEDNSHHVDQANDVIEHYDEAEEALRRLLF